MRRDIHPALEAIADNLKHNETQVAQARIMRLLARLSAGRQGYGRASWLVIGAVGRDATPEMVWRALELHASDWLEASDEEKAEQQIRLVKARQALRQIERVTIRRAA